MRRFILSLLAPKIARIDDIIITRDGRAYWVRPGRLEQMRVIPVHKVKLTEDE